MLQNQRAFLQKTANRKISLSNRRRLYQRFFPSRETRLKVCTERDFDSRLPVSFCLALNPIPPGLFEGGSSWGGGGGGRAKVPAAFYSKTINDNEMKFAGVVKDH